MLRLITGTINIVRNILFQYLGSSIVHDVTIDGIKYMPVKLKDSNIDYIGGLNKSEVIRLVQWAYTIDNERMMMREFGDEHNHEEMYNLVNKIVRIEYVSNGMNTKRSKQMESLKSTEYDSIKFSKGLVTLSIPEENDINIIKTKDVIDNISRQIDYETRQSIDDYYRFGFVMDVNTNDYGANMEKVIIALNTLNDEILKCNIVRSELAIRVLLTNTGKNITMSSILILAINSILVMDKRRMLSGGGYGYKAIAILQTKGCELHKNNDVVDKVRLHVNNCQDHTKNYLKELTTEKQDDWVVLDVRLLIDIIMNSKV